MAPPHSGLRRSARRSSNPAPLPLRSPPHLGLSRSAQAPSPLRPPHDLDLTRLPLPPPFSASYLLTAAAVLALLSGLLLYMHPRKRGVDAGEVQDLHNKAPRAAAPAQDKEKQVVAEMAGKAPEIDEDLHSRQLAVYGRETMKRLFGSNVLVSGLQGLGAEIAKNLVLTGVKSVTLHDDGKVELWDLSSNFFLSEKDVGQNRAQACVPKLQELNNAVIISTITGDLTKEQLSNFQVQNIFSFDMNCKYNSDLQVKVYLVLFKCL